MEPETPASAKPQSMPAKPKTEPARLKAVPLKKEKTPGIAGSFEDSSEVNYEVAARGERKFVSDIAQEEMAATNGEVFDGREFDEAVEEFEKDAHREPDRQFAAEVRYKLGKTYQKDDDCAKALVVYETIPEEHPDFDGLADVYIAMGECYLKEDKFDDARRAFELVRENFPDKGELVSRKIGAIIAAQKVLEKANETASEDSRQPSEEVD